MATIRYTAFRNDDLNAVDNSIRPNSPIQATTAKITTTDPVVLLPATGNNDLKNFVTFLAITNGHESVGTWVNIYDEDALATPIFRVYCAANGGGASIPFGTNPLAQVGFNKKLYIVCETNGAEVSASAVGFIN